MNNAIFFPQALLDDWVTRSQATLEKTTLLVGAPQRAFELTEAIHFLREVTGQPDSHDLVGKVKPKTFVEGLGGEIVESSVLLGDIAYDVVPGFLGVPTESLGAYRKRLEAMLAALDAPHDTTDEALLMRLIA